MKIKGFLKLFWMTLLIGTLAGFVFNLVAEPGYIRNQSIRGYVTATSYSSMWTAISLRGFFSYLILHRVGLYLFRSAELWNRVQIVLIAFAMSLRHTPYASVTVEKNFKKIIDIT
jgi:KinB signaling pathway activation protein